MNVNIMVRTPSVPLFICKRRNQTDSVMKHSLKRFFFFFLIIDASAQTPGFFLEDHTDRTAVIPEFSEYVKPTAASTVTVAIDFNDVISPVSKYVFGNNANPYMTQMIDQPVFLDHVKALKPNVIRFPGGNISSVYIWNKAPGNPPADAPTKILDANGIQQDPGYWYGKNNEGWTVSVDNYYAMLDETNNTGMITVNYGYARYGLANDPVAEAAHLAADWVRYDNGRTKFWEIGNESNGSWQAGYRIKTADNKDGQPEIVTGALYGKHFRQFADSMRKAADEIDATIYIGAQLLQEAPANWWNNTDKNWNTGVFQEAADVPDYYIIHSYYTPYNENSTASVILNSATTVTTDMMEYVTQSITAAGRTQKPIALTEWNIFAVGSKQMISNINGMHAAITLGELIKHKYGMASRWDLANGYDNGNDHGVFSSGNEPGIPQWNPRPAFYHMYYFQKYFGDEMVESNVEGSSDVLSYASRFSSGEGSVVMVNKGTSEKIVTVEMKDHGVGDRFYFYTLTGGTDNGEFSLKVLINGEGPTLSAGGPLSYATIKSRSAFAPDGIRLALPARSVTYLIADEGDDIITANEADASGIMRIYPHPANSSFEIELPYAGFTSYDIIDGTGRRRMSLGISPGQTRVAVESSLAPGFYILNVHKTGVAFSRKLIIK